MHICQQINLIKLMSGIIKDMCKTAWEYSRGKTTVFLEDLGKLRVDLYFLRPVKYVEILQVKKRKVFFKKRDICSKYA